MRKHGLFAKLKKCQFSKNKVCFLGYVVSVQRVQIEDKKIETVNNWPEPKSVHYILAFLGFANFYWSFIQGFNKIAGPLPSILKTTNLSGSSTILQSLINALDQDEVGKSGGNKRNLSNLSALKRFIRGGFLISKGAKRGDGNTNSGGGNTKKGVKAIRGSNYLTPDTKKVFNHLRHMFIQALIF